MCASPHRSGFWGQSWWRGGGAGPRSDTLCGRRVPDTPSRTDALPRSTCGLGGGDRSSRVPEERPGHWAVPTERQRQTTCELRVLVSVYTRAPWRRSEVDPEREAHGGRKPNSWGTAVVKGGTCRVSRRRDVGDGRSLGDVGVATGLGPGGTERLGDGHANREWSHRRRVVLRGLPWVTSHWTRRVWGHGRVHDSPTRPVSNDFSPSVHSCRLTSVTTEETPVNLSDDVYQILSQFTHSRKKSKLNVTS